MKLKMIIAALCVACVPLAAAADTIKQIRFGVDSSYPPFESKTPSGELAGFDIDLGNAICAKLNAKCVWVENSFDGMIPALQARKFDAINSSMSKNEQRLKVIDFTSKLYAPIEALIVKKGSPLVATAESLKGKRVGVLQGSTQETYARKYWGDKGVDVVPYQTQDLIWPDLIAGRVDAAMAFAPQADAGFLKTPPGKDFVFAQGPAIKDDSIFGPGVSIGVRKDDTALRDAINGAIDSLRKDGTYDKIAKKYFNFNIYGS
ncbi:ABC transporter substrate-binding protein [Paraburkholderia nemoris]|uniref:ABC transporter substrate-binding protein n=1 Tax=Paraburkholderia nemoris TaxID=2793076 RepID=UPI0038BB530F